MHSPMSSDLQVNVRGVFGEPQGFVHFQKLGLVGHVIDMEAEDTINHVAVALVLEHFKGWITITGQSG